MKLAFANFLLFAAALAILAGVALGCVMLKHAATIIPTPAAARVWSDVWNAPPQFCPSPWPVCTGDECPPRRSKA